MGYSSSETNAIFFLTALEQALREQGFRCPAAPAPRPQRIFIPKLSDLPLPPE